MDENFENKNSERDLQENTNQEETLLQKDNDVEEVEPEARPDDSGVIPELVEKAREGAAPEVTNVTEEASPEEEEPIGEVPPEVLTIECDLDAAASEPQTESTSRPDAKAIASKLQGLLSTRNGRIVAGVAALLLVFITLFATHTICFHKWADATCIKPETCVKCGRTQGDPLGHDWQEATCTKPKTCARCGETEGKSLGHEVKEWKTAKEATCTKPGEEQGECIRCGEVQYNVIPMKDHEFGDWKTTKEASCTEEGVSTRKCKNCDETETKPIAKKDHKPGDWEIETPSTIDGMGGTIPGKRVKKCTVCGTVLDEEDYNLSAEEAFNVLADECLTPSYEDVARDPDKYQGMNVKFTGEVIQVLQDGNEYTLRVNVTNEGYYWTDTIMVYYVAQSGEKRILEDDVVTLYGPMHGMYSYESVLGATITVPLMEAYYVKY